MYYLFVAKDLHITAYIEKKVNNTIAKCNIKLVREINSYRVCYTDTLINLNVVTIYKLGDSELIYKFIEDVKAITEIELELLNKINYCINNNKSFKVIIIDNAFDFIPIDFFRKKQFTTDFMEYLVSLSLNEFDIKYFSK